MRLKLSIARWLLPLGLVLSGCSENAAPPEHQVSGYQTYAPLADTTNIVFVLPVDGIGEPAKLILADALAASLRDAARPAVISETPNTQGPNIFGRISEVRKRGTIAWVTANWELRTPTGETVTEISHEVVVDKLLWNQAGVEAVNLIIAEAEPRIIGMVSDHVGPLMATQDVAMPPVERMQMSSGASQSVEQLSRPRPRIPATETTAARPVPDVRAAESETEIETQLPPELNSLTVDDIAVAPPVPEPKAPVRLVPRAAKPMPGQVGAEPAGEAMNEAPSLLESMMSDNAEPDPQAEAQKNAKALTDGLLEMADIPKEDSVPDNTKLKPVVWASPSFLVRIVSGAPGDGNESLTSSLKAALRGKDMTVTEDPRQAAYEVKGRVVVGPPVNGRQQARIVWRVNTVDGDEVGQAVQENAVIAGSLDGNWGRVAKIVSDAAVSGIQELFDGEGRRRSRSAATTKFPDVPPLPQEPGRAPPPAQ